MRVLHYLCVLLSALPLFAQSHAGELRVRVTDPTGFGVKASITLTSDALEIRRSLDTDDSGSLAVRNLPFGPYHVQVDSDGFSSFAGSVAIHSELPTEYAVRLNIAAPSTRIDVTAQGTLLDPTRTTSNPRVDLEY